MRAEDAFDIVDETEPDPATRRYIEEKAAQVYPDRTTEQLDKILDDRMNEEDELTSPSIVELSAVIANTLRETKK